ncbi:MAG: response regulator [Paenibacillaceae bacterium]|nr:response regulator [Paenibacillaceae bacterium]
MTRVMLVDDEKPALRVLAGLIAAHTDFQVAGMFTKPTEALQAAGELKPDVVFLDIEMPGMSGMELANHLKDRHPEMEIVFVTAFSSYAVQAFRVNAIDYLLKPITAEELARCADKLRRRAPGAISAAPREPSRLLCLGGMELFGAGSAVSLRFPTSKSEELLAFLSMNRDSYIPKWTISDRLWPDTDPDKAEQNLHTTVYRLKKTLVEHNVDMQMESQRGSYRITGGFLSDYGEFNRCLAETGEGGGGGESEAEACARAIALYRGTLFGDKDYSWCIAERERLERHFTAISKKAARVYAAGGRHRLAADTLHALLDQVPYDEEGHELLLQAYAELQDRVSFLKHYEQMKTMLREELDLQPNAVMTRLYERMTGA